MDIEKMTKQQALRHRLMFKDYYVNNESEFDEEAALDRRDRINDMQRSA